jgi:hypothetical protein
MSEVLHQIQLQIYEAKDMDQLFEAEKLIPTQDTPMCSQLRSLVGHRWRELHDNLKGGQS